MLILSSYGFGPAKKLWYKCFLVNFIKVLRTIFFKNAYGRLVLCFSSRENFFKDGQVDYMLANNTLNKFHFHKRFEKKKSQDKNY